MSDKTYEELVETNQNHAEITLSMLKIAKRNLTNMRLPHPELIRFCKRNKLLKMKVGAKLKTVEFADDSVITIDTYHNKDIIYKTIDTYKKGCDMFVFDAHELAGHNSTDCIGLNKHTVEYILSVRA